MFKIVFDVNFYKKWLLKTCFLHFEVFWCVPGTSWNRFLGVFGGPFGVTKQVQNRSHRIPTRLEPASLVPNALWKASFGDVYWFLKGLDPFWGGFGGGFFTCNRGSLDFKLQFFSFLFFRFSDFLI